MLARRAIQIIPKTPYNHFFYRSRFSKTDAVQLADGAMNAAGQIASAVVGLAAISCVGMFSVGFGAGYVVGKRRERKHQSNNYENKDKFTFR